MSKIIGINPGYDYLFDPQQAEPVGFCPICGGEIYCEGKERCAFCDSEMEDGYHE